MLCRTLVAAQSNSFSRPGLPPRRNNVRPGGAFKSSLPPRPPAEQSQAEQGDSGNKNSRPDNGRPPGRGGGVLIVTRNRRVVGERGGGGVSLQIGRKVGIGEVKG